VFVSGQGPIDSEGLAVPLELGVSSPDADRVRRLIETARGRMDHIVKCTCYLADLGAFAEFDTVYREVFADPRSSKTNGVGPSQKHWNRNRRDCR
jgi:2-iminobutanoate/2-iminopropanoate deaminase